VATLKKTEVFALTLSLLIHLSILSFLTFKEAFSTKTYQIVNAIPLTFDTEVESNLIGVKPTRGKEEGGEKKKLTALPSGKRSKWENQRPKEIQSKASEMGEIKKRVKRGDIGRSGSYTIRSLTTGRGNSLLSLSVETPGERKNSKELPSVAYNKLVPYLIKVRDKIMKNWTPPYYKSSEGKRKVVVSLKINSDGSIEEINIIKFSEDTAFNRSAVGAIYASEPFGKFPKGVNLKKVSVRVNFEVR
jgi:protein TonB